MFNHLYTVQHLLRQGASPRELPVLADFVRPEADDFYSICCSRESDAVPGNEFQIGRLYFWPDHETKVIHILTIGTSSPGDGDIAVAFDFARAIKTRRATLIGNAG
jgi:hypothetical protein